MYTLWLKRTTNQNIVIGGAAGAVPVLIGWSSVTNTVSVSAVVLFALIFFWTPPHFWALAIKYADDYSAAEVPMMPSVRSMSQTTLQMVIYTVVVVATSLLFGWTESMGPLYWIGAAVLGAVFLQMTWKVRRTEATDDAIRQFTFSITYITLLFAVMEIDLLIRSGL